MSKHNSAPAIDTILFFAMILLIVIGLIMLISASSIVGIAHFNDSYYFIKKQLLFIGIGFLGCLVGMTIPYHFYQKNSLYGYSIALLLMLFTLIPGIGKLVGGASRWIDIGLFSLQPIEIMKFFIVVSVASFLANKHAYLGQIKQGVFAVLCLVLFPLLILFFQPDLGNLGLVLAVVSGLLFISPIPIKHLVTVAIGSISVLAISIMSRPYQQQRILAFLNPDIDPLGRNYHMTQSLIAIGSGGFWGTGLGEGKLKYFYLPLQYSDFIFSIICEEGGFILATLILLLFTTIIIRTFKIARYASTPFGFYLAMGLMLIIVIQALFNMGVVMGMLPVTGIPLTFISFGGTSLVMSMFCIGVLLNISKESRYHAELLQ
jgi:cell division protein FtsW